MRARQKTAIAIAAGVATVTFAACGGESRDAGEPADDAAASVALAAVRQDALQNEWVEAFTLTLDPGQSIAPHDGTSRVVYALGDYTVRYTAGDSVHEASWRAGEAHAHAAGTHAIANIGTTPARMLIVARTDAPLPGGEAAATGGAASGGAAPLLDDEAFRVDEVTLAPGASLPAHDGLARVIYALGDYTLRYEAEGAEPVERAQRAGEAHWHDADRHAMTNVGTTEARFLVVQFRR